MSILRLWEIGFMVDVDIGSTRDFLDRSEISDERTVKGVQSRFRQFTGSRISKTKAMALLRAARAEGQGHIKRERWAQGRFKHRYWVVWRVKGRIRARSKWP